MEERRRDYKTALQELAQRQADQVLTYRMIGEEGPDHDKTFQAEVLLNGTRAGTGCGHSKKEAEQSAAGRPWKSWAMPPLKRRPPPTRRRDLKAPRQEGASSIKRGSGGLHGQLPAPFPPQI